MIKEGDRVKVIDTGDDWPVYQGDLGTVLFIDDSPENVLNTEVKLDFCDSTVWYPIDCLEALNG